MPSGIMQLVQLQHGSLSIRLPLLCLPQSHISSSVSTIPLPHIEPSFSEIITSLTMTSSVIQTHTRETSSLSSNDSSHHSPTTRGELIIVRLVTSVCMREHDVIITIIA